MKDFLQRIEKLSPKRLALLAVEQQARLEALNRAQREPVAIIGMGCRFPGEADSPETFWSLLARGGDAITEVPAERFDLSRFYDPDPAARGKVSSRFGGFIRNADKFDAAFFGISRREAAAMDPQQRILLEVAWEALERAAISPRSLAGSHTGIFVGLSTADYCQLLMARGEDEIDGYTATGAAPSIAAGRLSYILGLHGPSITLDTSCSSSLVAIHQACMSLRASECDLALAGGVNLVLSPETSIALSKARMLAPDGRCKAFDAAADGFVRSEGCGVLVLKLLSKAIADRDNMLAVIRGSALNQDGRSSGLTAPNGAAQEDVIKRALDAAGVKASDLQYVEAHGTGTGLGDPIEAHALAAALGRDRDAGNLLYVGSVKTNIGHLEAAAGVAGVIKTVLSLCNEIIPPNLHFSRLNPHIDLQGTPLTVPTMATPWPRGERSLAGVSSFGFSGSNAHLILENAPVRSKQKEHVGARPALGASARSAAALREVARRYSHYLDSHPEVSLADFCYTAATGRSLFEHKLIVEASSVAELSTKLREIADGERGACSAGDSTPATPASGDKIVLPTYPFERQRYWVEAARQQPSSSGGEIGFYRVEWERKQLRGAIPHSERQSAAKIAESLAPIYATLNLEHGFDRYASLKPELDHLSLGHILGALQKMGWSPAAGETTTTETLQARLQVKPKFARSFLRLLEILAEEGVLEREGAAWKVVRQPAVQFEPAEHYARLIRDYPQFRGELTLTERCGSQLASALQGDRDPLHLLFPDGSLETAEEVYEKSAGARVFQTLIQQSVVRALEQFPAGAKIRILEVGAGTGGTTSYVARVLPGERTEYFFTDISRLFTTRAARKFQRYPFMRFEVLDIERDPESQGFPAHGFDLVIASNCLHATADLRQTMRNVIKLLAPSGMLILLEGTRPERCVDITFGLIDGWWRFTDTDLRPGYPLISRSKWEELLTETGFREVATLPADPDSNNVLLLASRPSAEEDTAKSWLIISNSRGMASAVVAQLQARGEQAVVVQPESRLPLGDQHWQGILDLAALDVRPVEELTVSDWGDTQRFGCERVLSIVQKLANNPTVDGARLWVVTADAQHVVSNDRLLGVATAPIWGLARTISLEHPAIWGGMVDLDPSQALEAQAAHLVDHLCGYDGEDQVSFRNGVRYVARLKPSQSATTNASFRSDACYLITGGLGGLGLLVARWMAECGARRLILTGRAGVTTESQTAALHEIEKIGASVRVMPADITNRTQVDALFKTISLEEPPLKGVIHSAVERGSGSITEISPEALRSVLRTKVLGTWLLHEHTRDLAMDFFCLFSSAASVLGARNLGHYAAANQFLNVFAQYRRRIGLPATSVPWGAWDEMRAVSDEDRKWFFSSGLLPMPSAKALGALGDLLAGNEPSVMVAALNWATLKPALEARRPQPLLEEIELAPAPQAQKKAAAPVIRWDEMSRAEREKRMMSVVWEETCQALQIEANAPMEPDRGFFEMGMDSLVSVEMKTRLEARVGRTLPSMLTFNYPTVRRLANRLSDEFSTRATLDPPKPEVQLSPAELPAELNDDDVARLLAEKLKNLNLYVGSVNPG